MMKKFKSALFLGTVLFLSVLFVLPAAPALAQKDGGMLRYPISAEPRSTDPHNWYNDKNSNTGQPAHLPDPDRSGQGSEVLP